MRFPGVVCVLVITVGGAAFAQQQPAVPLQQPPSPTTATPGAPQAPAPGTTVTPQVVTPGLPVTLPTGRVFAAEAGMILNPIRPDKVPEFEYVLGRLHQALARSTDPVRKQQAEGWKVFKDVAPGPNGSVIYIFLMSPAVKGADYTVSKILTDVFPDEVQEIWKLYTSAFASAPSLLNMELTEDLSGPERPVAPFKPGTAAPFKPAPATPPTTPQR